MAVQWSRWDAFDMKITSWEDLRKGKGVKVLEFNGASSDPAHIYDPDYSLIRAYRDIFYHWKTMRKIARQNRKAGKKPATLKKILSGLIIYFRYKRTNNWRLGFLIHFAWGWLCGFLGTLPFGTINVSIAEMAIQRGTRVAISMAVGAAFIEFFQSYIALSFYHILTHNEEIERSIILICIP